MLPTAADNGGRLAAILPTGLLALTRGLEVDAAPIFEQLKIDPLSSARFLEEVSEKLPSIRALVVIAVDGLGSANLKARLGHAPALNALSNRRITTVTPSTTAAALTSLTTGQLPGTHGLVGYKILHPELGLIIPLRDWGHIDDPRNWQRTEPLFHLAERLGAKAWSYGRPAHSSSGFTGAVLSGTEYVGGERIADRLQSAKTQLQTGEPTIAYVYVDELDRAGHRDGWQSDSWVRRLEQFDTALSDFLTGLPANVGVVITADHGMVDIARHQQIVFDLDTPMFADVEAVGGEPRFRSFYLKAGVDPQRFAEHLSAQEGKRAWVATREEILQAGFFGQQVPDLVARRVGDVVLAARGQCAYYTTDDDPQSLDMVGQHGSWTDEERGVPLIVAGAFAGTGFASVVERLAQVRA